MTAPQAGRNGRPAWASHDLPEGPRAVNAAAGLVSLSFIGAALHRRVRIWITTAVAGLLLGAALFVLAPPPYQASTSLILKHDPTQNPPDAMQTDVALVETRAVASAVVNQLRLKESVTKFLGSYTVAATTDQIMTITLSAATSPEAVSRASALAAAFLSFRANGLRQQQVLVVRSLKQQVTAQQRLVSTDQTALSQAEGLPASVAQRNAVRNAKTTLAADTKAAVGMQNGVTDYPTTTAQEIEGSHVYDIATPLPRSRLRLPLQYVFGGLLLGLVVGFGIVIVGALASDRLRRRDDIARALGAPVRLSVGRIRAGGLVRRRGLAAANGPEFQRIVGHLRTVMPAESAGPPALAVVPADRPAVAALAAVSLALSFARQHNKVLFADLSSGAYAARLLGVSDHGIRSVTVDNEHLVVAIPEGICPTGPLGQAPAGRQRALHNSGRKGQGLATAYRAADVVVTLATLDPALGGDHLGTWASAAVVLVSAGECSATGLGATAEMIRLAGVPLVSAVLLGADKNDDSVGADPAARHRQLARPAARRPPGRGVGVPG